MNDTLRMRVFFVGSFTPFHDAPFVVLASRALPPRAHAKIAEPARPASVSAVFETRPPLTGLNSPPPVARLTPRGPNSNTSPPVSAMTAFAGAPAPGLSVDQLTPPLAVRKRPPRRSIA